MAKDRLIVALDFTSLETALKVARRLRGLVRTVKIGSALFTACGPEIIGRMRSIGFRVMLDLKFFDIPSTVELSCRAAARHRVSMLTVHASGGPAMLAAAVRGVHHESRRLRTVPPRVLGVTVLTSVDGERSSALRSRVIALTRAALQAGCDGVVASAREADALRRRFGRRLHLVCPGIRPHGRFPAAPVPSGAAALNDQRRVCTPRDALARGADALIIGRPITAARDPRAAAERILNEMEGVP
ncbi:MAG: orotidine-5'-phosphate decarboxylase [Candidatus Omnitrophica bacterium]|nr:orotidine-5'-phosphate decarboxylase [Candidatus Omnitrophota bacterium]